MQDIVVVTQGTVDTTRNIIKLVNIFGGVDPPEGSHTFIFVIQNI